MTRCKSLLFFPVVSTSVPREYRFHFQPPFWVNSPSLYLSVGTCIRYFITTRCISNAHCCQTLPCVWFAVLCTWCQAGRVAKQPFGSYLGLFKWQTIRPKSSQSYASWLCIWREIPLVACVCVCVFFFGALPVYLSCFRFFCCMFNVEFYVLYFNVCVCVDMQMLKGERRLWHSCSFPHFNIIWRTQKGGKKMI